MKFLLAGIITGFLLNGFFIEPEPSLEILPEFYSNLYNLENIEKSKNREGEKAENFFVQSKDKVFIINSSGKLIKQENIAHTLVSFSGNGEFFIKYEKVGKEIEFYRINGERYWVKESREYPYISYNGKLVFLLNGDHSSIRFFDNSGNNFGSRGISGLMCTAIAFSRFTDFGAAGFFDGKYYIVNDQGNIVAGDSVPRGNMIKSIAVSRNGNYAAVHFGNINGDYIRILNIKDKSDKNISLKHVHPVKTSLHVDNMGNAVIIDIDNILYINGKGNIEYSIKIPKKRYGQSKISKDGKFYSVSYTKSTGESKLIIFMKKGTIIFSKEFPAESFLDTTLSGSFIFLRGSNNIFCYSIRF